MTIKLLNMDCMDYMKTCKDNEFDLAIVDPPYGIGAASDSRFGVKHRGAAAEQKLYDKKDWDSEVPQEEYFNELKRVSKNQIIWGVNYYPYPILTGGRIFWDKCVPEDYSKSKGEIAYKSKGHGVDYFRFAWHGMIQGDMKNKENRVHPTQKPVKLYQWLLDNYAEPNQRILDTHLGSGSSAIAAHYFGCDFVGIEIDEDYFKAAQERFDRETRQEALF